MKKVFLTRRNRIEIGKAGVYPKNYTEGFTEC